MSDTWTSGDSPTTASAVVSVLGALLDHAGEDPQDLRLDGGAIESEPGERALAVLHLEQREQGVLGADVVVAEPQGGAERELERLLGRHVACPATASGSCSSPSMRWRAPISEF
ncbi:MAG TPA: hypothetical protein VFY82_05485 [Acidimicrobiales bacterium]|nr:hypothetical protein [Acidimicrobiales bacterium]